MTQFLSKYALIILGAVWIVFGALFIFSDMFSPAPVVIEWSTETEFDTAGFNIYRSEAAGGPFEQVNAQLIPAKANAAAGASYTWSDTTAESGKTYYYQLEDVELDNGRTRHEPFVHQSANFSYLKMVVAISAIIFGLLLVFYGRSDLRRRSLPNNLSASAIR